MSGFEQRSRVTGAFHRLQVHPQVAGTFVCRYTLRDIFSHRIAHRDLMYDLVGLLAVSHAADSRSSG